MSMSYKEMLIDLISNLQGIPPADQAMLCDHLKQEDIIIPETQKGKDELYYFFPLLFSEYPYLMDPTNANEANNYILIDQFSRIIEGQPIQSGKPNK